LTKPTDSPHSDHDHRQPAGPRLASNLAPWCDDPRREESLRASGTPLGIESVEAQPDQLNRLTVHFLHDLPHGDAEKRHAQGHHRHRGPSHAPIPGLILHRANVRVDALEPGACPLEPVGDPEWCRDDAGFAALEVELTKAGGSGTYRLMIVEADPSDPSRPGTTPHPAFDPLYSFAEFSFNPEAPPCDENDFDRCGSTLDDDGPPPLPEYLAKDYTTFRNLMFDRLAQTLPGWSDRDRPADLWTTLVEAIAYEADHLSYAQDAVAAEAYLGTARRRSSVRRHVRLVDDKLHDGCNARAWIVFEVDADAVSIPKPFAFYTEPARDVRNRRPVLRLADLASFEQADRAVFAPVGSPGVVKVHADQNAIVIHTWGDAECRLPRGATSASLVGRLETEAAAQPGIESEQSPGKDPSSPSPVLRLKPGDLLLFEEVKGAWTGLPTDADPSRRHAVRIKRVVPSTDRVSGTNVVEVVWDEADALPFPFCLSAVGRDGRLVEGITVVRGNVVLADHGLMLPEEELILRRPAGSLAGNDPTSGCLDPPLGAPWPRRPEFGRPQRGPITRSVLFPDPAGEAARQARQLAIAPASESIHARRHRRRLRAAARGGCVLPMARILHATVPQFQEDESPPSWADPSGFLRFGPASEALTYGPVQALPSIDLAKQDAPASKRWTPRPDLIESGPSDRHFAVETDADQVAGEVARLLFGDGDEGRLPTFERSRPLLAHYRIGNGAAGNVGAEAINHLITESGAVPGVRVRNPLPARGGVDPRPTEEARRLSPTAFRRSPSRAVAPDDYARLAERHPAVQRAAAEPVWTGSGYEMRVAVDLLAPGGRIRPAAEVEAILAEIAVVLLRARRIGHDVRVVLPRFVPVTVEVTLYLEHDALPEQVTRSAKAALRRRLAPDALTFGQGIAPSVLIADLQALPGVCGAQVDSLRRTLDPPDDESFPDAEQSSEGQLSIGPLEIARMDDNTRRPDRGTIIVRTRGGR
jgi:Baseplate J-like protein